MSRLWQDETRWSLVTLFSQPNYGSDEIKSKPLKLVNTKVFMLPMRTDELGNREVASKVAFHIRMKTDGFIPSSKAKKDWLAIKIETDEILVCKAA